MKNKIAIIDLGTNTCNLLIAEYDSFGYQILYRGKEAVKLGKNGIDKNMLTPEGLERAVSSLRNHQDKINQYEVDEIITIATSAIRQAFNKDWFEHEIKELTGLQLSVISGDEEAKLIFKGVKLAFGDVEDHTLILDIGGGSNEFILTEGGKAVWKQSFPLGVARVVEYLPPSNPITEGEIQQINKWFNNGLAPLWERLNGIHLTTLIGCSGAFDTIVDLLDHTDAGSKTRIRQDIAIDNFNFIYQLLIQSTTEERIKMKGMESLRVEMIVPAILFIKLVLEKLGIQKIIQTDFALMEGVIYDKIYNA